MNVIQRLRRNTAKFTNITSGCYGAILGRTALTTTDPDRL